MTANFKISIRSAFIVLGIFLSLTWLQSYHLKDPIVGDEILYLYNFKCETNCRFLASFYELHFPTIKLLNSAIYAFGGKLILLRLLGIKWFSFFIYHFYDLCCQFFRKWTALALTVFTLTMPIFYAYATSFESFIPSLLFITLLIKALVKDDEKWATRWFILGSLVHFINFPFGLAAIALKRGFQLKTFTQDRALLGFILFYSIYIGFLLLAKPLFGLELSSMRINRHFTPPRQAGDYIAHLSNLFHLVDVYLPAFLIFISTAACIWRRNDGSKNYFLQQTSLLFFALFLGLHFFYNSLAPKNAALAAIFLLPALLTLFSSLSQKRLVFLVVALGSFINLKNQDRSMMGRYGLSNLKVYLGYGYQVARLLEKYDERCVLRGGMSFATYIDKFYRYTYRDFKIGPETSDAEIIARYHEMIYPDDLINIPRSLTIDGVVYDNFRLYHNFSARLINQHEKLDYFTPVLPDGAAFTGRGIAVALYSTKAECLPILKN